MLGVHRYGSSTRLVDQGDRLALSWTSDERDLLDVDLPAVVRDAVQRDGLFESGSRYPVTDPYATAALTGAVDEYFGRETGAVVLAGAGVNGLLAAVAQVPAAGIDVLGPTYPDLPHWAALAGRSVAPWSVGDRHGRDRTLFLERPNLVQDTADDLRQLQELTLARHAAGGLTVVDESNANYLPPSYSGVALLPRTPGLVVLRGLSKAYGLGGWRLGIACASPDAAHVLRSTLVPLQAASLSIVVGSEVLRRGDVAAPLRRRIEEVKPQLAELVRATVSTPVQESRLTLPYLFMDDPAAGAELAACGIDTKLHVAWTGDGIREVVRVSVPLVPDRLERAVGLLTQPG